MDVFNEDGLRLHIKVLTLVLSPTLWVLEKSIRKA